MNEITTGVKEAIRELGNNKIVFLNETDLMNVLAFAIHRKLRGSKISLEYHVKQDEGKSKRTKANKRVYIDMLVEHKDSEALIELNYKTRAESIKREGIQFELKNHGALDLGRYAFLKDVERLEKLNKFKENRIGICLLLTNDEQYWIDSRTKKFEKEKTDVVLDLNYRLHDGIKSDLVRKGWNTPNKSQPHWTDKHPEPQIHQDHDTNWEFYTGNFRYLLIEVK